jgi:aryl-alcohol dehydrogenase-like predicted oxidoreductase
VRYKALGQTGLSVSTIGFGASPLGNVFGTVPPEQGRSTVHHAIDHGINLFDVSPYYGLTLAEERLGEALAGRRNEIVLATKCGRYGSNHFDFSVAAFERPTSTYSRCTTLSLDPLIGSSMKPFTGFNSVEQVDDALQALHFEVPQELSQAIFEVVAPVHNRAWASGLPENQPGEAVYAN